MYAFIDKFSLIPSGLSSILDFPSLAAILSFTYSDIHDYLICICDYIRYILYSTLLDLSIFILVLTQVIINYNNFGVFIDTNKLIGKRVQSVLKMSVFSFRLDHYKGTFNLKDNFLISSDQKSYAKLEHLSNDNTSNSFLDFILFFNFSYYQID